MFRLASPKRSPGSARSDPQRNTSGTFAERAAPCPTLSQGHKQHLNFYWVQTGEVTSTRRNSAGMRYLQLAIKTGLVTPMAGMYRTTRIGLVLSALVGHYGVKTNPFYLTPAENLFHTYWILDKDADLFLTILGHIAREADVNLSQLQRAFQSDLLARLGQKISVCQDEALRRELLERRLKVSEGWRKPERYAEHLVPPRLNWALDLDLLEPGKFRRHRYVLTTKGVQFLSALPCPGNDGFHDVTDQWLASEYWSTAAKVLLGIESLVGWDQVKEQERTAILSQLLRDVFGTFRYMAVPKVSLTQAAVYLSVRFLVDYHIGASPSCLSQWFSAPRVIEGWRYEVRLSPRENESYLLMAAV